MKRKSLASNTIMLYMLTGSNYLFGLLSIPYLTRVLGAETYGIIGFGTAFQAIVLLVLDFGFSLSGMLEVARHQDDLEKVQHISSAVLGAKLAILIPTFLIVLLISLAIQRFNEDLVLFLLYFGYAACTSLMPDFLYRGLENMTTVTIRSVFIKLFFVVCIFFFVKQPSDYHLVPLFYLVGSCIALITVYQHAISKLGIKFVRVTRSEIFQQLKKSSLFFLSRIAGTIFSSVNSIVLGFLYPTGPNLGFYTAANTAVNAGKNLITPVTGSLFPHIVRTKNYKLMFATLMVGEILLIAGCIVLGIYAEPVCVLIFGDEFAGMAPVLRIMMILVPISLATYLFGWSGLGALGLDKVTNISVIFGALFQIAALAILLSTGHLDLYTLCVATVATETLVAAIRGITFAIAYAKQ